MDIGNRVQIKNSGLFNGRRGNVVSRSEARGKLEEGLIPVRLDGMGIFGFAFEDLMRVPVRFKHSGVGHD